MDFELHGKRALVTGASQGIGSAIAHSMADEGCDLVLVARRQAELDQVSAEIKAKTGRQVDVVATDLSDGTNVKALARDWPDVDVVINNAGAIPAGTLFSVDEDRWRAAFDLKVFGYTNMCREFYPILKARGGGVIINVIGSGAIVKYPRYICGAVGNAALYALTQTLGAESHVDGVRVVGLSPGPVQTPRWDQQLADNAGVAAPPNGVGPKVATPQDIASVVTFLASARASHISGSVVHADGGLAKT